MNAIVSSMARIEYVARLKEGAEIWNEWRRTSTISHHDFTNADLSGIDLGHRDGVNLSRAVLIGANLSEANLSGADLSMTRLMDADLTGADLRGANLIYADLRGANLSEAILFGTVFGATSLIDVRGLESCVHRAPSIIGIDTLYNSGGTIPESFLRGCGVPEQFITFARSLVGQVIQFYSCFISYSTKDQDFADRLHADLQNKGVRCWFARDDLKIGDPFRQRIDEAIRLHDKLLLILSAQSVQSDWVREEVESCLERERRERRVVLFPVRLDDAIMDTEEAWAASIRRQRHLGDFRQWTDHDAYRQALERLLRDLKS